MRVILLAAGKGRRFGKRTKRLPKCLIPLGSGGETLLSRYLASFRALGLRDVVLVLGHKKEKIIRECVEKGRGLSVKFLVNPDYEKGSIVSLCTAAGEMDEDCLLMDADVFFRTGALKKLVRARNTSFLLDPRSKSGGEEMMVMAQGRRLVRISKKVDPKLTIVGEAVGFFKVKKEDAKRLAEILKKMVRAGKTGVEYEESYNELMKVKKVGFEIITGFWTEMDFEEDLKSLRKARAASKVPPNSLPNR